MDTSSRSSIFSIVAGDKPVPLARPLVLVGFMAVGKSTIGRLLADRLEVPFADTDAEIERAFGMTVADIFRARGEAEFRDAERRVISGLLAGRPMILAAGGGAFVGRGDPRDAARIRRRLCGWTRPSTSSSRALPDRTTGRWPLAEVKSNCGTCGRSVAHVTRRHRFGSRPRMTPGGPLIRSSAPSEERSSKRSLQGRWRECAGPSG